MLAFAAQINLTGADADPADAARLAGALPRIDAPRSHMTLGAVAVAQLGHAQRYEPDDGLPLRSANGAVVVGALRIDARDALSDALRAGGRRPAPNDTDASLVLAAYQLWGDRLGEHLIGDYAIVVWDAQLRRLVCLRDPLGNRPLYWGQWGSVVALSTTPTGVRAAAPSRATLDDAGLAEYLALGHMRDRESTVWHGVRRVPPAHTVGWADGAGADVRRHWDFPVPTPHHGRDDAALLEQFRAVLGDAVRDRLRVRSASVALSGGMDSTMLAATARTCALAVALHALTVAYPRLAPSRDEVLAPLVAAQLGISHEVLEADDLPPFAWLDAGDPYPPLPFSDSDLGLGREQYRRLAAHGPVVLYGEDGDTLLQPASPLSQVRTHGALFVARAWWRHWQTTGRRPWLGVAWRARLARRRVERIPAWMRVAVPQRADAARPAHPTRALTVERLTAWPWEVLSAAIDPSTTLADTLITLPLMDPRVIAFVFALPSVPWGENKTLFRRAMVGRLPSAVLERPKEPLAPIFDARVAQWRAQHPTVELSSRVDAWVDRAAVTRALRDGSSEDVYAAWRVLALDRWLAAQEQGDA